MMLWKFPQELPKWKHAEKKEKLDPNRSRDRKKAFVEELEARVKFLEKENMRLHNLLEENRKQKYKSVNTEADKLLSSMDSNRKGIIGAFMNKETGEFDHKIPLKVSDIFKAKSFKMIKTHQKIMSSNFEMIIDNIYPVPSMHYWKHLTPEYDPSYDVIKKYNKLTKYQVNEFVKENNLNDLDLLLASFNPNKRQFNFLKEVYFKKELLIKQEVQEGLKCLCKGKEIISKTVGDFYALRSFLIKSGVLDDQQMVNSILNYQKFPYTGQKAYTYLWDIEKETKILNHHLGKDPLYGKLAKRLLSKEDQE